MIILIYIGSLKRISGQILKKWTKQKSWDFTNPPLPFSLMTPKPKQHPPNSPHIHQKMRKGCRNDYIKAFGAVYWAKKLFLKRSWGLQQPAFGGRGLSLIRYVTKTAWLGKG